ncbi:MAG: GTP cyclohydrolase I FolE [Lentisphaeria bacterium]|nr:GTP cyclohydrolase I FolE [Victivallales bacterium]MBR6057146.1 GTP cyclohydrolase I FolE [Victivallales bacterium]MCR4572868.1 GTP cyclohydrolase I FolE [Lentisphaeria bacterium]
METSELIHQLLINVGEDPEREGLRKTPERVAKSYEFLLSGYRINPDDVVGDAIFHEECNHMIIVKDIEVYSLCEHHMLPFYGRCHIGYIPRGKVFGVSKLARLVDCFARRLQIQERLTQQIATYIKQKVDAEGVGVVMECHHLCMMMRGVEKQNSCMVTSAMQGSFLRSAATRNEYLRLIHRTE